MKSCFNMVRDNRTPSYLRYAAAHDIGAGTTHDARGDGGRRRSCYKYRKPTPFKFEPQLHFLLSSHALFEADEEWLPVKKSSDPLRIRIRMVPCELVTLPTVKSVPIDTSWSPKQRIARTAAKPRERSHPLRPAEAA